MALITLTKLTLLAFVVARLFILNECAPLSELLLWFWRIGKQSDLSADWPCLGRRNSHS